MILLMKWYGGPGRRGPRRAPVNASAIGPSPSVGLPQAQASSEA
jgi:hypothetical protein